MLEVEIEPTGRVNFFLNGERLVYEVWPGGPPRMVGVSAMGMGRFAYDGFTVTRTRPLAPGEGWGSGDRTSEVDEVKDPAFQIDDLREAQVLLGVTFGVLLHEFGHAVIGELELPATGPEEDVADGFAALALGASLSAMPDLGVQIEPDFLEGVVEYSVLFWYHSGRADQRAKRVVGWQGEHAPDIRRFRTAFCLVYSSNPDRFEDIADRVSASDRTKQRCFVEWKKQSRAWLQLLKPHRRSLQRADAIGEGGHIMVTFVEPRTQMGRKVADLLQTGNLLANFLRMMEQEFVFPRDMRVVFRHCDEPNAFYNPELGMIIMCFEAIEYFARITLAAEDAANPLTLGTATTASAGTEETGNSEQRAAEVFLAGEWEAVLKIGAEDFPAQAVFADDRGFSMRLPIEDVPTEIEGEWQVSPVSPGRVTLALRPSSWSPREICQTAKAAAPMRSARSKSMCSSSTASPSRSRVMSGSASYRSGGMMSVAAMPATPIPCQPANTRMRRASGLAFGRCGLYRPGAGARACRRCLHFWHGAGDGAAQDGL